MATQWGYNTSTNDTSGTSAGTTINWQTTTTFAASNLTLSNTTLKGVNHPCDFAGHKIEELIEYIDGLVVGSCVECGERVSMDQFPAGGIDLLRVKALIANLRSEGHSSEAFGEYMLLREHIQAEIDAVAQAQALLNVIEDLLGSE